MTDTELRIAIDQAWAHTQKTGPGPRLREAEEHLTHLRAVQADRAKGGDAPMPIRKRVNGWARRPPTPPPSTTGI